MLLIIVLGLIAKLVLVCDGCDVGTTAMTNFDFNKVADSFSWYALLHSTNLINATIKCVDIEFASPVFDLSAVTVETYLTSAPTPVAAYGTAMIWNSSGYFQVRETDPLWNGQFYVIATDYTGYAIFKVCPSGLSTTYVYLFYRSNQPDAATVTAAQNAMAQNNIDVSQMAAWNC